MKWLWCALLGLGLCGASVAADSPEKKPRPGQTPSSPAKATAGGQHRHPANRLADETSPYLLLHAHNPVDWYPWGPEAFAKAKQEKKLIFLSIGYSSCYWCHVMERLVFSNPEIAKYMNEHFVNIKVDREERPDVDDVYMTALSIYFQLSGSPQGGGWPLSMFLTPDAKPVAGGTYFPPKSENGRIGFDGVMRTMHKAWTEQTATVQQNADIITGHVRRSMQPPLALKEVTLTKDLVTKSADALRDSYDAKYGGIDFSPASPNDAKFPVPAKLMLLEYLAAHHDDKQSAKIVDHTLTALAHGGIKDHLAGGFHRYSTERTWLIPHFEKMLYDNAQLADLYVSAYRRTDNPLYRETAEEVLTYVMRDMTGPRGACFSAQDAETNTIEGEFYVWSRDEVVAALGEADAKLFAAAYGLDLEQRFEHGHILHLPHTLKETAQQTGIPFDELRDRLAAMRKKLLVVRDKRQAPLRDDKVLTSWNGLMIRAFANAGRAFDNKDYIAAAERAARFILDEMRTKEGRLHRTYRNDVAKLNAYLDDYAFLTEGVIALYLATGKSHWLQTAEQLTDQQIEFYWDKEAGGFFFTSHDHEQLLTRTKNAYDAVLPSGNSVAVRNLIRLASLSKEERYRRHAEQTLTAFAPALERSPASLAYLALGLAEFLDEREFTPAVLPTSLRFVLPTTAAAVAQAAVPPSSDKPAEKPKNVKAQAFLSVDRLPAGKACELILLVDIKPGWHINTNPAKPKYLVPTRVTVESKQGVKLGNLRYPPGKIVPLPGTSDKQHYYEKQVALRGTLTVPAAAGGKTDNLTVTLHYQPCNADVCLRPTKLSLVAKIAVAPQGEPVRAINAKLFRKPAKK